MTPILSYAAGLYVYVPYPYPMIKRNFPQIEHSENSVSREALPLIRTLYSRYMTYILILKKLLTLKPNRRECKQVFSWIFT